MICRRGAGCQSPNQPADALRKPYCVDGANARKYRVGTGGGIEPHTRDVGQGLTPYCDQIVTVFLDLCERQPKNILRFAKIIVGFCRRIRYNK